jgi:hypothetical protein
MQFMIKRVVLLNVKQSIHTFLNGINNKIFDFNLLIQKHFNNTIMSSMLFFRSNEFVYELIFTHHSHIRTMERRIQFNQIAYTFLFGKIEDTYKKRIIIRYDNIALVIKQETNKSFILITTFLCYTANRNEVTVLLILEVEFLIL